MPCEIEEMTVELGSVLHEIVVIFVCNIRGKNLHAHIDKDIIQSAKDSFAPVSIPGDRIAPVLCYFSILRLDYPVFIKS